MLIEKVATVSQQLTYGHYIELLPYVIDYCSDPRITSREYILLQINHIN